MSNNLKVNGFFLKNIEFMFMYKKMYKQKKS